MIPVSLWPVALHMAGTPYLVAAALLSSGYLYYTVRFFDIVRHPVSPSAQGAARNLLKASVVYLPLLLAAMILDAQGRVWF